MIDRPLSDTQLYLLCCQAGCPTGCVAVIAAHSIKDEAMFSTLTMGLLTEFDSECVVTNMDSL